MSLHRIELMRPPARARASWPCVLRRRHGDEARRSRRNVFNFVNNIFLFFFLVTTVTPPLIQWCDEKSRVRLRARASAACRSVPP